MSEDMKIMAQGVLNIAVALEKTDPMISVKNPLHILAMASEDFAKWIIKVDPLVDWAKTNIPEMECRKDDDCDHCVGMQILASIKKGSLNDG